MQSPTQADTEDLDHPTDLDASHIAQKDDWVLVRIGVEAPIFALSNYLSKVVVGRETSCELRCDDEMVSRKHFELQRVGLNHDRHIYWNICDTSNDSIGTFVNGSRITKGSPVSK